MTGVPTPGAIDGSQTSMSNETWMPAVPWPARPTACSTTDAMPWRSMSFIVKTCTRESRTATFSRSSRLRTPMSTVCAGSTFGEKPPMPRQLGRLGAEQRRERHAVDVAAQRRRRRVHVAVRVDPEQADRQLLRRLRPRRGRRDRSGREAVVAAEHERQSRPPSSDARARLVQLLADAARCRRCTSSARRAARCVSGIGAGRSPLSTTGTPSAAIRSPRPAMRNADGPMSTPRRLPPRSSGTPMMWIGAFIASLHRRPTCPSSRRRTMDVASAGLCSIAAEEIAHLALLVDDVVGEEEAARRRGAGSTRSKNRL